MFLETTCLFRKIFFVPGVQVAATLRGGNRILYEELPPGLLVCGKQKDAQGSIPGGGGGAGTK